MPTQLYATLLRQTQQLRPGERRTRVRTWTWLLTGLYLSRCVHLSRIAAKIPGAATLLSTTRRLSRLLDNAAVRVRPWYAPIVRTLLQRAARSGEIRLLVDGSKVSGGHQLLIVSLAYGRRALPLVWTWVRCPRGHSTAWKQRVLLGYVQRLVPPGARVLVVGDSEFGAIEVIQQLEAWGWFYVLRQKGSHLVDVTAATLTGPALPAVEAAANAAALELTQGGTAGTFRAARPGRSGRHGRDVAQLKQLDRETGPAALGNGGALNRPACPPHQSLIALAARRKRAVALGHKSRKRSCGLDRVSAADVD
jgi:hypothetical protein